MRTLLFLALTLGGVSRADPLVLGNPWERAIAVPLRTLSVDTKTTSVTRWTPEDLGIGPEAAATVLPGVVRVVILVSPSAEGQVVEGPYFAFEPTGVPRELLFVTDGRGDSVIRGMRRITPDGGMLQLDVARFSPRVADPWGLSKKAHLVDLELNAGFRGQTGEAMVATNARVLDGTEVFPLDLEVLMTTLTRRAAGLVGLRRGALHEAMTRELAPLWVHPEATPVAKPLQTRSLIRWTDGLEVTTVFLDAQDWLGPPVPLPVNCAPGQPCQQQLIRNSFSVHGTAVVRQRISAKGVLFEETVFEPRVETTIR